MNRKHFPFWLITLSVFTALILPVLIQDGMFMDGLGYACVSKNLSDGLGTFWFPFFSETWWKADSPYFMEHPPLVYGIQSLFFTVLGDSMYVERIYSFITAIITAYLIILIWQLIFNDNAELRKLSWLPVLFWIIIPVCYWSYQNNGQENTMGVFTLSSVYFALKGLLVKRTTFFYLVLAGISIFLASFSKGIPGLFPVVVIFLYWLSNRSITFSKMAAYSMILLLIPVLVYSVLLLNDVAYESLTFYLNDRLLHRIQADPVVDNRFFIVSRLFMELLPVIIMVSVFLIIYRVKSIPFKYSRVHKNNIILFLLIGAAGSLPLILTHVQRGFYFVPSLPFYAIGFSLIIAPGLQDLLSRIDIKRKSFNAFRIISLGLLLTVFIVSGLQIGKKGRDRDTLHDVYLIGDTVPRGASIKITEPMYAHWGLQSYLIRYFNISAGPSVKQHEYFLTEKASGAPGPGKHTIVPLMTKKYDLYQNDL